MKPFSILLIKILGLYLALGALFSVVPAIFSPYFHENWASEWLPMLIATAVVPIVGGVLLWFSAGALANTIHGDNESSLDIDDNGLVRAGTFLIGVFLLMQHIGILVSRYVSSADIAYGSLIVIAVSLVMVLGTGFFAMLYNKVKYFGSRK